MGADETARRSACDDPCMRSFVIWPTSLCYCTQELEGVDDAADFCTVCDALKDVGVDAQMQVCACVHVCVCV